MIRIERNGNKIPRLCAFERIQKISRVMVRKCASTPTRASPGVHVWRSTRWGGCISSLQKKELPMITLGLLLSASFLPWAAFGFAGLGARVASIMQLTFSLFVLTAAGSLAYAQALGT
jgi:hypothetical protein